MHLAVSGIDTLYQLWVLINMILIQVCAICRCECVLWFLFQWVFWQALQDDSVWGSTAPICTYGSHSQ
jgi:hypothetical protein